MIAACKSHNQVEPQNVLVQSATGYIFLVKITKQRTERSRWDAKLAQEKLFRSRSNDYIEECSLQRKNDHAKNGINYRRSYRALHHGK